MKYKEQEQLVAGLRALADFIEDNIELPAPNITIGNRIHKWDDKTYERDDAATKAEMARLARLTKPVEKVYLDYGDFKLVKTFSPPVKLTYVCSREAVCTRVQTGTRQVEEYITVKTGHTVDEPVYEWECEDPLLAP